MSQVKQEGMVCTFYSYKGGVGRSMALANVGAFLAKGGYRVLLVDWDLEAPGLERYFAGVAEYVIEARKTTPGVLDVVLSVKKGSPIDWRNCVLRVSFGEGQPLNLITAGKDSPEYVLQLQELDWDFLFREAALGSFLENLRSEWISEFDFILIDSRTGITDVGGVCTIHMPDVLILLFTTNNQSLNGIIDVTRRARTQQGRLPFNRGRLLAVPIAAHDESRTEYGLSNQWRKNAAAKLGEFFDDWLPKNRMPEAALEVLRIPHIPYWTFGEKLPVVEEGSRDPSSLSAAYASIAKLISTRFDWEQAAQGFSSAVVVPQEEIRWDHGWLMTQRAKATNGLTKAGFEAFMEFCFKPSSPPVSSPPTILTSAALLSIAKDTAIHTTGWPLGVVLTNREDARPQPTAEGIFAEISSPGNSYDDWTLRKDGSFYLLRSLFEDDERSKREKQLCVDTRITQVTEAFLYCGRLLANLQVPRSSLVQLRFRHRGLRGRTLGVMSPRRTWPSHERPATENEIETQVEDILAQVKTNLVRHVQNVCAQLFELFDFAKVDETVYQSIVTDFENGRIV